MELDEEPLGSGLRHAELDEETLVIGVCLDTAHLFAAGYPFSTPDEVERTLKEFDILLGLDCLKVIHLNDSYFPAGSKKDRHQHIGRGYIGKKGIEAILNNRYLRRLPFILETPKDSPSHDRENVRRVKALAAG